MRLAASLLPPMLLLLALASASASAEADAEAKASAEPPIVDGGKNKRLLLVHEVEPVRPIELEEVVPVKTFSISDKNRKQGRKLNKEVWAGSYLRM